MTLTRANSLPVIPDAPKHTGPGVCEQCEHFTIDIEEYGIGLCDHPKVMGCVWEDTAACQFLEAKP